MSALGLGVRKSISVIPISVNVEGNNTSIASGSSP
jgi:hypothetical protein